MAQAIRARWRRAVRRFRIQNPRQNWAFLLLTAAALVLPAALFLTISIHEYRAELREGQLTAVRTASALAEHADKVLETHALVLEQLDHLIRDRSWQEIANDQRLRRTLSAVAEKFPQIRSVWLVDARGEVRQYGVSRNVAPPDPGLTVDHLDYFRAHRGSSVEDLFISEPREGRIGTGGARQITVSIRRSTADGAFDGVISVSVALDYFTDFWKQVSPQVPHVIPLMKADGTMLVRYPAAETPRKLPASAPFMQQIARSPAGGFYSAVSQVDGMERMNAFRRVGKYPLYVSYSLETGAWLAHWRERAWIHAGLAVLASLALGALAWMALRSARTQRQVAKAWAVAARRSEAENRTRERLQAQLVQSQKMEAVGQLTGGVAHDFNNLLHVMSLNLQLAERVGVQGPLAKCHTSIRRAVDRATELTRQLTAFSRRHPLAPRDFGPAELVVGMADLLQRTLGGNIEFVLDAEPEVHNVHADPTQTELALLNLAVNARDAMPNGGRLTLRVRNVRIGAHAQLRSGDYVELAVSDNGVGMPEEVALRVFEPFFTTKEVGKGSGLGLSMVHGFAIQSGGNVSVLSRLGEGTMFSLLLPSGGAPPLVAQAPAAGPAPGAAGGARLGGRVLLVDDHSLVRSAMLLALRAAGYNVDEAANGAEALEVLRRSAPDILVTDFAMPGMNGIELATLARSMYPGLPVILCTGYAEPLAGVQESTAVACVLHKPFSNGELLARMEGLLWAGGQMSGKGAVQAAA